MARAIANPVEVDFYRIAKVEGAEAGECVLTLEDGREYRPEVSMLARMTPQPGDYLVVQGDGYHYLNPKDVFERKYTPITQPPASPLLGNTQGLNPAPDKGKSA
jgi:hypothetical protein